MKKTWSNPELESMSIMETASGGSRHQHGDEFWLNYNKFTHNGQTWSHIFGVYHYLDPSSGCWIEAVYDGGLS